MGHDRLWGAAGADTLNGGLGKGQLWGEDGNDLMYGGLENDRLLGHAGNDTLHGDAGNDRLIAGPGQDVARGGAGADTFVFRDGDDRLTIRDFSVLQGDRLELDDALFGGPVRGTNILDDYASIQNGNIILDFGGGDIIVLEGLTDLSQSGNHVVIV